MYSELNSFLVTPDLFIDENGQVYKESGIEDVFKYAATRVNKHIMGAKLDNSDGILRFHKEGMDETFLMGIQEVKRVATRNVSVLERFTQALAYYIDWTDNFPQTIEKTKFILLPTEKSIEVFIIDDAFRESSFFQFFTLIYDQAKDNKEATPSTLYKHMPMQSHMFRYRDRLLVNMKHFDITKDGLDYKDVINYVLEETSDPTEN